MAEAGRLSKPQVIQGLGFPNTQLCGLYLTCMHGLAQHNAVYHACPVQPALSTLF